MSELTEKIDAYLNENLSSELFEHSLGTRDYALELNEKLNLGLDKERIILSALLHDIAKEYGEKKLFDVIGKAGIVFDYLELDNPVLLHGQVGAYIAGSLFGIEDEEVLKAIRVHTTGNSQMSDLDLLIFIADKLEPTREFDDVEKLRKAVEDDFLNGALKVLENHRHFVTAKGLTVHPRTDRAIESIKKRINAAEPVERKKDKGVKEDLPDPEQKRKIAHSILTMDGFIVVCALIALVFGILASSIIGVCYMYNLIGISENNTKKASIWTRGNRPPSFFFQKRKELLFLVGGLDGIHGNERTDTLMLVRLDFTDQKIKILSIPRDTLVKIPNKHPHWDRINVAYPTGKKDILIKTIHELTGVYPDFLVLVNFDGFKKIVDIIGGVELDVEKDMNYEDHAGKLYIHLKQGTQVLDGEKALGYVRFRKDTDGDFSRIRRQQNFFNAFKKRMFTLQTALRSDEIIQEIIKNIDVSAIYPTLDSAAIVENGMSLPQFMVLAKVLQNIPDGNITADTLKMVNDGVNYEGMSVQVLDYQQFDLTMQDFFTP